MYGTGSACSTEDRRSCSRPVPPAATGDEIDRALRFAGVDGLPLSSLTLIEAPAGFGKTTLLRQWSTALNAQGIEAIWVSFAEAACRGRQAGACLDITLDGAMVHSGVGHHNNPSSPSILRRPDRVLFLDDIHHVAPAIIPVIAARLQKIPRLHIVATSRRPLSDQFLETALAPTITVRRWRDLAYTPDDLGSLPLAYGSAEAISALCYRLKGWPALVSLLQGIARHWPGAILDFAIDSRVEDAHYYFAEEIYCELDGRERAVFDLAMSSLHLTPRAVRDMLGFPDGDVLLERLDHHYGLFEACEGTYRVHEVIRSLARRVVQTSDPDTHLRIAHRFERKGDHARAIVHAVEAGDGRYAADMLSRSGGWDTALQIGSATLDRLCALVPATDTDLQLSVACIYVKLQSGRIADARRAVDTLKQLAGQSDASAAARSEWLVLHMLVAHYQNRIIAPDLVDRLSRELAIDPGANQRVLMVLNTFFRAYAYYDVGDYGRCLHWLGKAARGAEENGLFYAWIYALVYGALASFRRGNLPAAAAFLRDAERVAGRNLGGIDLQRHQSMIQIFGLLISWEEMGEGLSVGEIEAIEGRMLAGYDSWPPIMLCFYLCTSEMIGEQQGVDSALAFLDRGIALARREGWNRVAAELTVRKIFLCLEAGALDQAADLFPTIDPIIVGAPNDPHLVELVRLAEAWQMLAEGDDSGALAILGQLNRSLLYRGHGANATMGLAIAALAQVRQGAGAKAQELMVEAMGADHLRRHSRWFKRLRTTAGADLIANWPSSGKIETGFDSLTNRSVVLTEREFQTLRLVVDGHCIKEIARLLGISPGTAASYRKQGYRKLCVSKRSELAQNSSWKTLSLEAIA